MQKVQKRIRKSWSRWLLLAAAAASLVLIAVASCLLDTDPETDWPAVVSTAETLYDYSPAEVASITIRRDKEDAWTVIQAEHGLLTLHGEEDLQVSASTASALLDAACIIPCEAVLTDDPSQYQDHLADFGLDSPRYEAVITYTDGVTAHLMIGHPGAENNAWYYMIIEGDNRLFSFSRGMVESLFISRDSLRDIRTPTIHKARIDQITLAGPDSLVQWSLTGAITDMDAADKWRITAPYAYPAAPEAMDKLLSGAANIRLGAYVAPATPENRSLYGFDTPRVTITLHMAEGSIAVTNYSGAVEITDYPDSTVTFVIGGAKNDMVDYVLCEDHIYVSSHFTVGMFIDYDAATTMSRYPVMTALGNLASLTIQEGDTVTEYVLIRTEQVAANNTLITDEYGHPVYDVSVTRNGAVIDYDAFEAAYDALTLVTVSGTLPAGETATVQPHTCYTFTDVDGTVHTVALATFDALHDAVIVDGHQAFYLIKGGFKLKLD